MLLSLTAPPATGYDRLTGHRSSERDPRASACRASEARSAVLSLDSRPPALPHAYPLVAGLLVAPIPAIAAWQFQVFEVRLASGQDALGAAKLRLPSDQHHNDALAPAAM